MYIYIYTHPPFAHRPLTEVPSPHLTAGETAGASASLERTGWRCGEEIAEQGDVMDYPPVGGRILFNPI